MAKTKVNATSAKTAMVASQLTREESFALLLYDAQQKLMERDAAVIAARDAAVAHGAYIHHHVAKTTRVSAAYTGSFTKTLFFGVK